MSKHFALRDYASARDLPMQVSCSAGREREREGGRVTKSRIMHKLQSGVSCAAHNFYFYFRVEILPRNGLTLPSETRYFVLVRCSLILHQTKEKDVTFVNIPPNGVDQS